MRKTEERVKADANLIAALGGAGQVASMLGYKVQRVSNWVTRGIPADEKIGRPDLFLTGQQPGMAGPPAQRGADAAPTT